MYLVSAFGRVLPVFFPRNLLRIDNGLPLIPRPRSVIRDPWPVIQVQISGFKARSDRPIAVKTILISGSNTSIMTKGAKLPASWSRNIFGKLAGLAG